MSFLGEDDKGNLLIPPLRENHSFMEGTIYTERVSIIAEIMRIVSAMPDGPEKRAYQIARNIVVQRIQRNIAVDRGNDNAPL